MNLYLVHQRDGSWHIENRCENTNLVAGETPWLIANNNRLSVFILYAKDDEAAWAIARSFFKDETTLSVGDRLLSADGERGVVIEASRESNRVKIVNQTGRNEYAMIDGRLAPDCKTVYWVKQ